MHLALLSPLPPEQNGIAAYAEAFRSALEGEGIRVSTPLQGRTGDDPGAVDAAMGEIDWRGFDVVHGELGGGRTGEFLALDWLADHHPNLPLTATIHDPERILWKPACLPTWVTRSPRWLRQASVLLADPWTLARERRLAARLSRLVTLTRTGAELLAQRMRIPVEKVSAIPHGNHAVEAHSLPLLPPQGPLKLLYFGFIYRGKGIEDLIDAIALLRARCQGLEQRLELTVAGGTAPDLAFGPDGSYLDALRTRLRQAGLEGLTVHWRLDLPEEEIPALIQSHHVMVLPYRESAKLAWLGRIRGTSGALSWAAACGRSVITSDARAFPEEVSFGNGAVFPQGDAAALMRELEHLLERPDCITERSERAAQVGADRQWARIATRFHAMFRELRGGRGSL